MTAAEPRDLAAVLTPIIHRFETFFLNRPPRESSINVAGDLVLIRWRGILSDPERRMLQSDANSAGRETVEALYRKMVRNSQEALAGAIEAAAGRTVAALFYDIDTLADEALLAIAVS